MNQNQSLFQNTPADNATPSGSLINPANTLLASHTNNKHRGRKLVDAAHELLPLIETGKRINKITLKDILQDHLGGSDATNAWSWKDAWETTEAGIILFLLRWGVSLLGNNSDPARTLRQLHALEQLEPTQTYRSEQQERLQQFSTTLPLAYLVSHAGMISPNDRVLEPSAGTGLLAAFAATQLGPDHYKQLWLNEIDDLRHAMLTHLFPGTNISQYNAEQIQDRLPASQPSLIIMNPPFSHHLHRHNTKQRTDMLHIYAALKLLRNNGRLVTITAASCAPMKPCMANHVPG